MKRLELTILAASLVGTIIISSIFGLAGGAIVGTFWSWFWISLLVQIIGFAVWNSYLIQKQNAVVQELEIQALEQLSKFVVGLSCAYCKQNNNVPIQLNRKNTFKCDSCNQVNGVYMQFSATTLTTPIESVKLPLQEMKSESIEFKMGQ
jgi:hypothetical protein